MKKIVSLSLDLETRSSVDIAKSGVYRYAESDDFPRYGIRARLQYRELTVHMVVHQGGALVGFLQHGISRHK